MANIGVLVNDQEQVIGAHTNIDFANPGKYIVMEVAQNVFNAIEDTNYFWPKLKNELSVLYSIQLNNILNNEENIEAA